MPDVCYGRTKDWRETIIDSKVANIIERARNGDSQAIENLLHRSQVNLRQFASGVCTTPEDVNDAVQEALWIISRKVGKLSAISAFFSWSKQIVVRECLRLKNNALGLIGLHPLEHGAVIRSNIELSQDLIHCLSEMSFENRELILLHDLLGHTIPEISEQLNLSYEATKSRIRRARAHLRDLLVAY